MVKTRRLGRTGLEVSPLCLGTMTFGAATSKREAFSIMDAAVERGITFFDTADMYSHWVEGNSGGESETVIGQWLKKQDRRRVTIATKVRARMWDGPNGDGLSRAHIIQAVEDSLRRLQTDYIDLYQTHWFDENTPIEETLSALDALVQAGKVRYIGASNYPAWRLTKALWASDVHNLVRYESLQPHYSLLHRKEVERELADLCLDQQIGVIPYSPLAAGFLTGKYTRESREQDRQADNRGTVQELIEQDAAYDVLDVVQEVATAHDAPMTQVALAWLLSKPFITAPIVGVRTMAHLEGAVGAMEIELTDEALERLDTASVGF